MPFCDMSASQKLILEDQFFDKRIVLSQSALNKLLFCPQSYYNYYILQQKETESSKYAVEGKMMHCLLLNPEVFHDEFVISPTALPSEKLVAALFTLFTTCQIDSDATGNPLTLTLSDYQEELLVALTVNNLYQSYKDNAKKLSSAITDKSQAYWEFLVKSTDTRKSIVSYDQFIEAQHAVDKIKNNVSIMKLMGYITEPGEMVQQMNEQSLQAIQQERDFDIKGILDNYVVNHMTNTILVNDLKKTSKDILSFEESILKYRYDLQAAMYYTLIRDTVAKNYPGYAIEFRFIVVDNMLQIAPVRITPETMNIWLNNLEETFAKATFHFKERRFDLPYSIASNNNEIVL